ncbi:MAG: hypothetical protein WC718_19135, partial [Phycisphaerales bacterium]
QVLDQADEVDLVSAPIRKLSGVTIYGLAEPGGDQVWVDECSTLAGTLVHELIHTLKGRWAETKVDYMSRRVINAMTEAQIAELAARYHATKRREALPVRAD